MKQQTLAGGFEKYQRTTKRGKFLSEMEQIVPWAKLCRMIEPYYYTGRSGHKLMGSAALV